MERGVSCIIPAFNEAERIEKVIKVAKDSLLIDEIIVVNDGSTDNTSEVIRKIKDIRIIDYSKNRGKTFAVMRGIKASKNDILLLLDSDLIGLTSANINDLIEPVVKGEADVSISLRMNGKSKLWKKMWSHVGVDPLSGERVFHKSLIGDVNELKTIKGYELESFLNKKIIKNNLSVKIVEWNNVFCPYKSQKLGNFFLGAKNDAKMMYQICESAGVFGLASSIYYLRKQSI